MIMTTDFAPQPLQEEQLYVRFIIKLNIYLIRVGVRVSASVGETT